MTKELCEHVSGPLDFGLWPFPFLSGPKFAHQDLPFLVSLLVPPCTDGPTAPAGSRSFKASETRVDPMPALLSRAIVAFRQPSTQIWFLWATKTRSGLLNLEEV
eukprot:gene7107-biopygen13997